MSQVFWPKFHGVILFSLCLPETSNSSCVGTLWDLARMNWLVAPLRLGVTSPTSPPSFHWSYIFPVLPIRWNLTCSESYASGFTWPCNPDCLGPQAWGLPQFQWLRTGYFIAHATVFLPRIIPKCHFIAHCQHTAVWIAVLSSCL